MVGASTTRHTSSPRTSPVTTPCSTVRCAPAPSITSRTSRWAGRRPVAVRQRLGDGRQQRPLDGIPDGDREREPLGAPGEQAGVRLGDQVERRGVVAERPRQRGSERTSRIPVDQHPRPTVDHERGAVGEAARRPASIGCPRCSETSARSLIASSSPRLEPTVSLTPIDATESIRASDPTGRQPGGQAK